MGKVGFAYLYPWFLVVLMFAENKRDPDPAVRIILGLAAQEALTKRLPL